MSLLDGWAATLAVLAVALGLGIGYYIVATRKKENKTESAPICETQEASFEQVVDFLAPAGVSKRFIIVCGIQGSGKSTLAKALAARGFERICLDKIIKAQPWLLQLGLEDYYWNLLGKTLKSGANTVDDNLNISARERGNLVKAARRAGYTDIVVVHMDTPLELCLSRNVHRAGRRAPERAIREAWGSFQKQLPICAAKLLRLRPAMADGQLQSCEYCH